LKLSSSELGKVLQILEKIDRGLVEPEFHGRVGRFLRQYAVGHSLVDEVLGRLHIPRRTDGAISGERLGAITLIPMLNPEVSILHFPLGEVAETIGFSEELGGFLKVTMWLKAHVASSAFALLNSGTALNLSGDFRWSPSGRLTPGEARLEPSNENVTWETARCLKAVADDIARPPHAAEYILDYRMGPPGIKYFRTVCVLRSGSNLQILPALESPRELPCSTVLPEALAVLRQTDLSILLIYREPWDENWTVVRATAVSAEDVLAHSITWADFRKELDDCPVEGSLVAAIAGALRAAGLRARTSVNPNFARSLLPAARVMIGATRRWS
jgi:hypothetical protein